MDDGSHSEPEMKREEPVYIPTAEEEFKYPGPESMVGEEFDDERPVVVISREEWGARPPKETSILKMPVERVGITFNSRTETCTTKEECIKIVQQMQNRDMDEYGQSDIAYSWMVGGDGNVYEGRGWNSKPNLCLENPSANFDHMIDVTYIGDFESEYHPFDYYTTFINFIRDSIFKNYIIEEYEYR